jgi:hypothetical protein
VSTKEAYHHHQAYLRAHGAWQSKYLCTYMNTILKFIPVQEWMLLSHLRTIMCAIRVRLHTGTFRIFSRSRHACIRVCMHMQITYVYCVCIYVYVYVNIPVTVTIKHLSVCVDLLNILRCKSESFLYF